MKEIGLDFLFNIYFLFKNVKFLLNSINYFLVFLSTAVDHPSSPTGFAGERARGGASLGASRGASLGPALHGAGASRLGGDAPLLGGEPRRAGGE